MLPAISRRTTSFTPLIQAIPLATRHIHITPITYQPKQPDPAIDPKQGGKGFLSSLIYGSPEAKAQGLTTASTDSESESHSKLVGRGKYVHEKITHAVHPHLRDEYLSAAEKYFTTVMENGQSGLGGVKLTGSWETIVGGVGEFTHILEYEGYKGFDVSWRAMREDPTLKSHLNPLLKTLQSREHQILSEFSFWPSSPPRVSGYKDGGIFEMRSYRLVPGKLLEWEGAWRRGLEARAKFVKPVGAFFAQVGQLHEVHHIWQYPNMEERKKLRESAWNVGGWSDTVQQTVKLAQSMETAILIPCSWSPLR